MKAVIFTTDAVFALVIVSAAISILLYFHFSTPSILLSHYSGAKALLYVLLSSSPGSYSTTGTLGSDISAQSNGSAEIWNEYEGGISRNPVNAHGPLSSSISYILKYGEPITTYVLADYGNIYFAAGNTLYAVNATYGVGLWSYNSVTMPSEPVISEGLLIYYNATNITALYADSGVVKWSHQNTFGSPLTQGLALPGSVMYGVSGNAAASFYTQNGILESKIALQFSPSSLAVMNGSVIAESSSGHLELVSPSNTMLWYIPYTVATDNVSVIGNLIAYGNATIGGVTYGGALYINGTLSFSVVTDDTNIGTGDTGSAALGTSGSNGTFVYQTSNELGTVIGNGFLWWLNWDDAGAWNSYPVIGGSIIYSESGNTIEALSLSGGDVIWRSEPLSRPLGPMSLAYGRLFVPAGNTIVAFGTCSADPNSTVLASAVELSLNNQGSCASALLNSVYSLSNYSVSLNGSYITGDLAASFNGRNSMVGLVDAPSLNLSTVTITAWVKYLGQQSSGLNWIAAKSGTWGMGLSSSGSLLYPFYNDWGGTGLHTSANGLNPGQWYFISAVVTPGSPGTETLYVDGKWSIDSQLSIANQYNGITFGYGSDSQFFNGLIANMQIYSTDLSQQQLQQLYYEGIGSGPLQNSSLMGWWPLDGNANDYSRYNNTGYPYNMSYVYTDTKPFWQNTAFEVSKSGTLLGSSEYTASFSGTNSYISLGNNAALSPEAGSNGKMTLCTWYNVHSLANYYGVLLKGVSPPSSGTMWEYTLDQEGQKQGFTVWSSLGAGIASYSMPGPPIPNRWYFACFTYDYAAEKAYYYLNGNQYAASPVDWNTPATSGTGSLVVGAGEPTALSPYSNVTVANLQIYSSALGYSDILQLYHAGISGAPLEYNGLVGWWSLNGDVNDQSWVASAGTPYSTAYNTIFVNVPGSARDSATEDPSVGRVYPLPGVLSCTNLFNCYNSSAPGIYLGGEPLAIGNAYPQVLSLNGTGSYVLAPVGNWLESSKSNITALAWFYAPSGVASPGGPIVGICSYPTCTGSTSDIDLLGVNNIGTIYGLGDTFSYTGSLNRWYFAAITYNQKSGAEAFYVNSTQVGTSSSQYVPHSRNYFTTYTPDAGLSGVPSYFNGYLSNIQIYNTTLTSNQIIQVYKEGIAGIPLNNAGLSLWMPLSGNCNDYSGNGNNCVESANATYVPLSGNYVLPGLASPSGIGNAWQMIGLGTAPV